MQKIFERLGEWPRWVELVFVETVEAQFYDVGDLSRARDERSQLVRATRADGDADACSSLVAHHGSTAARLYTPRGALSTPSVKLAALSFRRACVRRGR